MSKSSFVFVHAGGNGVAHEYFSEFNEGFDSRLIGGDWLKSMLEKKLIHPVDDIRNFYLKKIINTPHSFLHCPAEVVFKNVDETGCDEDSICTLSYITHNEFSEIKFNQRLNIDHKKINIESYEELGSLFCGYFDLCVLSGRLKLPAGLSSFDDVKDYVKLNYDNLLSILVNVAKFIHDSPFENVSKFINGTPFHTGLEMWRNFSEGFGGVCAEKASALKYFCDILEIENKLVAGLSRVFDRDLNDIIIEYSNDPKGVDLPRVQHLLNLIRIGNEDYLVDSTGGNIQFLFVNSDEAKRFFKNGYKARMFSKVDRLFLYPLEKSAGDILLLISEFHLPFTHWDYTFDQGLGLAILPDMYVGAYFDWGGECTQRLQSHYSKISKRLGFESPLFVEPGATKESEGTLLGVNYEVLINEMIRQYWNSEFYTGHISLCLQPYSFDFWRLPVLSNKAKNLLLS